MKAAASVLAAGMVAVLAVSSPSVESCFRDRVNAERTSRNIPALRGHADVTSVARRHSDRMAAKGTIFHNPNLARELPPFEYAGENVGMGNDCPELHREFMGSQSHRHLILAREYVHLGVGVTIADGTVFVTLNFFTPKAPKPKPTPSPCRCR